MRLSSRLLRQIGGCLVISSLVACGETWAARAQQVESVPPGQSQPRAPDSGTQGPEANSDPPQTPSDSPQAAPPQPPAVPHEPVGTAAAPYEKVTGVPASMPAGAAIAPAKQKRTRSILIKVGLIVAAGVAIGTVVALSTASSSKPH
jgi:hypothetical protein